MGDMHDHDTPEMPGDDIIHGLFSEPARAYIDPHQMATSKAEARARMDRAQHLSREKARSFRNGAWTGFFAWASLVALVAWLW